MTYRRRHSTDPELTELELAVLATVLNVQMYADATWAVGLSGPDRAAARRMLRKVNRTHWRVDARTTAEEGTTAGHPAAGQPFVVAEATPFGGPGVLPGYVVGECGHRVARSEWAAGSRVCERCPARSAEEEMLRTIADLASELAPETVAALTAILRPPAPADGEGLPDNA